jgi:hypothetical protein
MFSGTLYFSLPGTPGMKAAIDQAQWLTDSFKESFINANAPKEATLRFAGDKSQFDFKIVFYVPGFTMEAVTRFVIAILNSAEFKNLDKRFVLEQF